MKRKTPTLIALALIFTVFSGCGNKPAATPTAIPTATPTAAVTATPAVSTSPFISQAVITKAGTLHNTKTNIDVALGMKKADIDKLLGTPSLVSNFNYYTSYNITVVYANDIAISLSTGSPQWETMDKVTNGQSAADAKKIYGDTSDDTYGYYFDKNSKRISNMNDSVATVILKLEYDKVKNITLVGKA